MTKPYLFLKYFEKHIEYIKSNKSQFILYDSGSGGEFLSLKISQYSERKYFKYKHFRNHKNRYSSPYNLLGNFFYRGECFSNITDYDDPMEYVLSLLHLGLSSPGDLTEYLDYLKRLDNHFLKGGLCLSRTHHFTPHFMNDRNTYYLHPDTEEMELYRMTLWRIKVPTYIPGKILADFKTNFYQKSIEHNIKIIQMSKMFQQGYLEDIFDIKDNNFHKDLILWHEKNLRLIEKDRGI